MKIGIISDTHDHHDNTLKAVEVFNDRGVRHVLHAGDIVAPFTAKAFADVTGAEFIAVFGNNEGEKLLLKEVIEDFGGMIYEPAYRGSIGGRRIFMSHWPAIAEDVAAGGKYDLVIYGHTHEKDVHRVGRTLVINPGEVTDWLTGRSSVVVLETEDMSVEEVSLG